MEQPDLAELRRLLDAATPGPWREGSEGNFRMYGPDGAGEHSGPVAEAMHRAEPLVRRANAALIVALRNAAPWLLVQAERAEQAEAENARLREALQFYARGSSVYPGAKNTVWDDERHKHDNGDRARAALSAAQEGER